MIGKGLWHHSQQTTAVYARPAQDSVADAWQKGTDAILVTAGVKPSAAAGAPGADIGID